MTQPINQATCIDCDDPAVTLDVADHGTGSNGPARPRCSRHARPAAVAAVDPRAALDSLGTVYSPDFDAYATGQLDASAIRCALCRQAPCRCPAFGTPEYLALIDQVHGRRPNAGEVR